MIKIKINPSCAWGKDEEIKRYIKSIYERQDKYGVDISDEYLAIAEDVNTNGFTKVENFIDPGRLLAVKQEFEAIKEKGELQYSDFYTEQVSHPLLTHSMIK